MPRVSWGELKQELTHALIVEVEPSFFGGPVASDPFDSHRLREATNLVSRLATQLKLPGAYSATPSRGRDGQERLVICIYSSELDRNRVADLVDARCCVDPGGWLSCRAFPLTDVAHDRLVKVAGETDNRNAGRRRREREANFNQVASLRWEGF